MIEQRRVKATKHQFGATAPSTEPPGVSFTAPERPSVLEATMAADNEGITLMVNMRVKVYDSDISGWIVKFSERYEDANVMDDLGHEGVYSFHEFYVDMEHESNRLIVAAMEAQ